MGVAPANLRRYMLQLAVFEQLIQAVLDRVTHIYEACALQLLVLVALKHHALHFECFKKVAEVWILAVGSRESGCARAIP